jgi:hypothetical protein
MSDPAIERLNYFNGQRLEAGDLKLEQDYHINVRRWLNRSLLTPGIAKGLEVSVKPGDPHTILVDPGLALDALGREIILVEQTEVAVTGLASNPGDPVIGNYLVIEYVETKEATVQDGCAVQLAVTCRATEDLAWGDPSRIVAQPKLSWTNQWPKLDPKKPKDYKIVLAQAELDNTCAVRAIRTFVRNYVAAALPPRVRALSIEGEKDIDAKNAKELVFHLEGGVPDRLSLFLRARSFSTLFYSEIGLHQHELKNITSGLGGAIPKHHHALDLGTLTTSPQGKHRHLITASVQDAGAGKGIEFDPADTDDVPLTAADGTKGGQALMTVSEVPDHTHTLAGGKQQTSDDGDHPDHTHSINGKTENTGQNKPARVGNEYTFVDDLHIKFDGQDITAAVLAQLQSNAAAAWVKLGDGSGAHQLASPEGTGEIDLLRLGLDIHPDEHRLIFSIPPANTSGGNLQYSLYID